MAYGVNAPFGLRPVKMLTGATYNGATTEYQIKNTAGTGYGTNLFTGDPVTLLSDGTIGIGVAAAAIVGVFQGCKYTKSDGTYVTAPYWPASTSVQSTSAITALVVDDPNVIFDIQSNNATGIVATDLNANANFVAGAGSTISGQSGFMIDQTTIANGATLNLKIMALTPNPTNVFGGYDNVLVLINNHIYKGGTGTAGV